MPALFVIVKQKNSCVVPSQRELECTHLFVCLQAYLGSLAERAAVFHVIVLYALFVSAEVIKHLEGDSSSLHGSIKRV